MDEREQEAKLFGLVRQILPPDTDRPPLSLSTKLLEDPSVDSLAMATLAFTAAEQFGLDSEDIFPLIPQFTTIGDMLALIRQQLAK